MGKINKKYTTEEFVIKAITLHGLKYDYSLVNYINSKSKIAIICKEHGVFEQLPASHLRGYGCSKCYGFNKTTNDFINESNLIHNNKYNYSLTKYINNKTNIIIICPNHGNFTQRPLNHLLGQGCPKCSGKYCPTSKEFIDKAIIVHGNKYDYSLVEYINSRLKIKIICPNHGIFEQTPTEHISGYGCIRCRESNGEKNIAKYLDNINVNYIREKRFLDCKNKISLPFDFYLPEKNLLIEFDGKQHLMPNKYFGGDTAFKQLKTNDEIKNNFAKNNNIDLLRIKYDEINNINQILKEIV